ncbi:adenylate/guanylate cyclase domain-containing protein [Nitratireductor mangrovi]|uniref:adenylate cyclase n=1 Tax=Nitratireductor mangrovi TaxID=2599600 RepID=A0A5B8KU36_9HYPH|nr:adenylate/guanylate cyclase domain-containing protein [Nitratireductor mangrovi]QDY99125.1 adenylate/guanylate cyclase domain-containing protein [Nitratireductor mangrovi]
MTDGRHPKPARLSDLLALPAVHAAPLPRWLEAAASFGISADDPMVVRRQRFTNIFAWASAANVAAHVAAFCAYDLFGLFPLVLADVVFLAGLLAVPFLHRAGDFVAAHVLAGISTAAILFTLVMLGRDSQIYVYFALAGIILFTFGIGNPRAYAPWFMVALASLLAALPLVSDDGMLAAGDDGLRRLVSSHAMVNVAVVNALVIYFVLSSLRRTEIALQDQHARASMLVAAVLPASVVERLSHDPGRRVADRIDGLSVLFADLAGFTAAARNLPPEDIVDHLDGLVRAFDRLCEQAGAEKIKTIGDSYMAVGGLNGDDRGGALAIGRLALAMRDAPEVRRPLGETPLALRIGIHSGSATAGIIGETRFTYDVWGDAVNVAARMESHGLPGSIQVSEAFRLMAGDTFFFEARGAIEVRGVGPMSTFLLAGERPATDGEIASREQST